MFELLGNSINESVVALTPEEDAFMESFTNAECKYDDAEEAFLYLAMENEQNFNAIMNAVAVQEMNYYVAHGEEMVYEAVDFKGFFETIKKGILRAWEKIKAVFKKIFDTIEGWIRSDKKFIDKYEADMKKADGTKIDFSGYEVNTGYDPIADIIDVVMSYEKFDVLKKEASTEELVKDVIGAVAPGATDKEGLVKYMKKEFGIAEKKTIVNFNATKAIDDIKNAKNSKKVARAEYDAAKKLFKTMSSACDVVAKTAIKEENMGKEDAKKINAAAGRFSKVMNQCTSLAHTALNVTVKAINISNKQAKAQANKAIAQFKKDDASTNESAMIGGIEVDLI